MLDLEIFGSPILSASLGIGKKRKILLFMYNLNGNQTPI